MALTVAGFDSTTLDYKIVHETVSTNSANTNVTGSTGRLYSIRVENTSNTVVYLKIHDGPSPVAGTTDPDMLIHVPAHPTHSIKQIDIPGGWPFTTGLNFWTVQSGAVADTTAPGNPVIVTLVTS